VGVRKLSSISSDFQGTQGPGFYPNTIGEEVEGIGGIVGGLRAVPAAGSRGRTPD